MNEKEIRDIIKELLRTKDIGITGWHILKQFQDENNNKITWALVFAWQDGFDSENGDEYKLDTYRICGKVAYNNGPAMMADYECDWNMPFKEDIYEDYDTECSIEAESDISSAISFWEECWSDIQKNYL